jgi:hypothetical protein
MVFITKILLLPPGEEASCSGDVHRSVASLLANERHPISNPLGRLSRREPSRQPGPSSERRIEPSTPDRIRNVNVASDVDNEKSRTERSAQNTAFVGIRPPNAAVR